jgi:hypothetical protein
MKAPVINIDQFCKKALLVTFLFFISACSFAQIDPTDTLPSDPAAITVRTVQHLNFGAFTHSGTGGTLAISTDGSRSSSGSIIPLNLGSTYFQAIFDVGAPMGSIISILFGPDATLSGSNGGFMSMHISNSDPPSPFVVRVSQPAPTPVRIGGILSVGSSSANPPGAYNGTFYITFNHE